MKRKKLLVWILLCAMLVTDIPAWAAVDGGVLAAADLSESVESGEERAGAQETARNEDDDICYISTAEELKELIESGSQNGGNYYELTNDIDLSGYDWTPVQLNGTLNGNGHTIKNVTITDTVVSQGEGYVIRNAGLFWHGGGSAGGYVTNLNLENIQIDLNLDDTIQCDVLRIAPVFEPVDSDVTTVSNCKITGSIEVNAQSTEYPVYVDILSNASNCQAKMNVEVTADAFSYHSIEVTVIRDSANCYYEGDTDIHTTGERGTGIYEYEGYLNAKAIWDSTGSSYDGDIRITGKNMANLRVWGAMGTFCSMEGDILVDTEQVSDVYAVGTGGRGSRFKGNVLVEGNKNMTAYGISSYIPDFSEIVFGNRTAEDCQINGAIEVKNYDNDTNFKTIAYGIYEGKDCHGKGEVSTYTEGEAARDDFYNTVSAIGMQDCTGSYYEGMVTAECKQFNCNADAYGGVNGKDNYFTGSVQAINSSGISEDKREKAADPDARGYKGGENQYVEGTVTAILNGLVAQASDSETIWQFSEHPETGEVSVIAAPSASTGNVSFFGSEVDDTSEWSLPRGEGEPEDVYAFQVINADSDKPVNGAALFVEGKEYTTDKNGMVSMTGSRYIRTLEVKWAGESVYNEKDVYLTPDAVQKIYINGLKLDLEDIMLGENPGGEMVTGPQVDAMGKEFPLFEFPISFEMNFLDQMQVAYDSENRKYQVIMGDLQETADSVNRILNADSPIWKKAYENMKKQCKSVYEDFRNQNFLAKNRFFGPVNGDMTVGGFAEISVTNAGLELTEGQLFFDASLSSSLSYPIPPAPYVFLKFGMEAGLRAGAGLTVVKAEIADPKFKSIGEITFTLTPSLGIGVGLDKVLSAEAGMEGPFETKMELPYVSHEENLTISSEAKAYLQVTALAFSIKFSESLAGMTLYPDLTADPLLQRFAETPESEDMTLIERDYLQKPAARSALQDNDTMKDSVYPYGDVQCVSLPDGKKLLVWLDDDRSRNLINKTALYYKIYEKGQWGEEQQITDDETADFSFVLCETNDGAVIVWQNADTALSQDAGQEELTKAVDLSLAYFDTETNTFEEPVYLKEENNDYEYSPKIYAEEYGSVSVIWLQNSANDMLPDEEHMSESIYAMKVRRSENGWDKQEIKCIAENLPVVYEMAAGAGGTVAYLTDGKNNSDTENESNRALVIKNTEMRQDTEEYRYEEGTTLSGLSFIGDEYGGGQYIFSEDGKLWSLYDVGGSYDRSEIINQQNFEVESSKVLMQRGSVYAIVYEVQDGFTSNLYASYYQYTDGTFTHPVPVTEWQEKIRSWDVLLEEDGTLSIGALLAEVEVGEEKDDMSETARLVWTEAEPREDISLAAVFTEEDAITPGSRATFLLNVENETQSRLDNLRVQIRGKNEENLYNDSIITRIPAGTTGTVAVDVLIPDDFQKQNLTVTVTGEMEETKEENNEKIFLAGEGNLTMEINGENIHSDGYLEAVITNHGSENVSDAFLTVTGEDNTECFHQSLDIIPVSGEIRQKITIKEEKRSFQNDTDSYGIRAKVSYGPDENGEDGKKEAKADFRIRPQRVERIMISDSDITLTPGDTYSPTVECYPSHALNEEYYVQSDNTDVAKVDADGRITAQSEGTAVLTFMAANSDAVTKITVTVGKGIDNPDPDTPNPDNPNPDDPNPDDPDPDNPDPDDPTPDTPSPDPTPGGDPGSGTTSQPGTPTQPGGSGTTPQPGGSGAGTGQTGNKMPQAASYHKVGDILTVSGLCYRVIDARSAQGQVQMIGAAGAAKKTVIIPAEIFSPSTGQHFKVTAIGNNAFKNQKKLRKLTIGKNVRTIGKKAFLNCKKLKNITMKTKTLTKKTVGAKAFRGIYARAVIKTPKQKRTLYRKILRAKGVGVQVRIR